MPEAEEASTVVRTLLTTVVKILLPLASGTVTLLVAEVASPNGILLKRDIRPQQ